MATANGTSWNSIKRVLATVDVDVVCGQEHKLRTELEMQSARAWARCAGWKLCATPAASGPCGGPTAGTFVANRSYIGAAAWPGTTGYEIAGCRAAGAWQSAVARGGMLTVSTHLHDGLGLEGEKAEPNTAILNSIRRALFESRCPWVIGGDFNVPPEEMVRSGWPDRLGGVVVAAREPTCVTYHYSGVNDYFIIDHRIVHIVKGISVVHDSPIATHRVVVLTLAGSPRTQAGWFLRQRKGFPADPPIGPKVAPPAYPGIGIGEPTMGMQSHRPIDDPGGDAVDATRGRLNVAEVIAAEDGDVYKPELMLHEINEATCNFYNAAEDELCAYFDLECNRDVDAYRGRAGGPRYVWRSAMGKPGSQYPASSRRGTSLWALTAALQSLLATIRKGNDAATRQVGMQLARRRAAYVRDGVDPQWKRRLRSPWRQPQDVVLAWARAVADEAKQEQSRFNAARRGEWRKWVRRACKNASADAYRFTKVPADEDAHGVNLGQPVGLQCRIAHTRAEWHGIWTEVDGDADRITEQARETRHRVLLNAVSQCAPLTVTRRGEVRGKVPRAFLAPLPRLGAQDVQAAGRTFKKRTKLGIDDFHPRWVRYLTDQLNEDLAKLVYAFEFWSHVPKVIDQVLMAMIAKAGGGVRGIGLIAGLLRLWARMRRPVIRRWELEHKRDYIWSAAGKPADRAVWANAAASEAAVYKKASSVSILMDIKKCFDHVPHDVLIAEATSQKFPPQILYMALAIFRLERVITLGGAYADAIQPTRSILAGEGNATAALRALMLSALDRVWRCAAGLTLTVIVDDVTARIVGSEGAVVKNTPVLIEEILRQFEDNLRLPVSRGKQGKTVAVANSRRLGKKIKPIVSRYGISLCKSAKLLGCDYAGGGSVSSAVRRSRITRFRPRLTRFRALKRGGGKPSRIMKASGMPSMGFGAAVYGINDANIAAMKTIVAEASDTTTRGRNINLDLMLMDRPSARGASRAHPLFRATLEPVREWAAAVWDAMPSPGILNLAMEGAAAALRSARRPWAKVRGPAGGLLCSLSRVGWTALDARTLRDHDGMTYDLLRISPYELLAAVEVAVERTIYADIAEELGEPMLRDGIKLDTVNRMIHGSKLQPMERAALRSTVVGAQWPQQRLFDAGISEDNFCRRCRRAPGTLQHRHFGCDDDYVYRAHRIDWIVNKVAREARHDHPTWTRCLAPDLRFHYPAPILEPQFIWVMRPPDGLLTHHVFPDGSGLNPKCKYRRRCGWGFVNYGEDGQVRGRAYGNLPSPLQTVPGAEVLGMLSALRHAMPPLTLWVDCQMLLDGIASGRAWCTSASRPFAGYWAQVWAIIGDDYGANGYTFNKVKAHRSAARAGEEGPLGTWTKEGNDEADVLAKKGARIHPLDPGIDKAVDQVDGLIKELGSWIGHHTSRIGAAIPRDAETTGAARRDRWGNGRRPIVTIRTPHQWLWDQKRAVWYCARCHRSTRTRRREECKLTFRAKIELVKGCEFGIGHSRNSHTIWRVGQLLWCSRCGGYATEAPRSLTRDCPGHPTPFGDRLVKRGKRGQHPLTGRPLRQQPQLAELADHEVAEVKRRTRAVVRPARRSDTSLTLEKKTAYLELERIFSKKRVRLSTKRRESLGMRLTHGDGLQETVIPQARAGATKRRRFAIPDADGDHERQSHRLGQASAEGQAQAGDSSFADTPESQGIRQQSQIERRFEVAEGSGYELTPSNVAETGREAGTSRLREETASGDADGGPTRKKLRIGEPSHVGLSETTGKRPRLS